MNILVVCAAGMSSSALVQRLRACAKERNLEEYKFGSCSSAQLEKYEEQADYILLAPQLSFLSESLKRYHKPIMVLNGDEYAMLDGNAILDRMLKPQEEAIPASNNLVKGANRFADRLMNSRIIYAMTTGFSDVLPVTICGSVFTLLNSFPLPVWQSFITMLGIDDLLQTGVDMTMGCISLYVSLNVARHMVPERGFKWTGAGLCAMVCFLMSIGLEQGHIDMTYLGGNGLMAGVLTGIICGGVFRGVRGRINSFRGKSFRLPMLVDESFLSILPLLACICIFMGINGLISLTSYDSMPELIEHIMVKWITPVFGKNDWSMLIHSILAALFWWIGIHGGRIIGAVTNPILLMMGYENLNAVAEGKAPVHIATNVTVYMYNFGGAGSTLGLVLLMCLLAKSEKLKKLGQLSLPLGLFYINEPILFGIPIIFNPSLFLPFAGIPAGSCILTVLAMRSGLIPLVNGVQIPWTTPIVISGFIEGGWKLALWQIFMLALQTAAWYPFFRKLDHESAHN